MCLGVLSNFFSSYPLEVVSQTYVGFSCLVLCGGLFGVFFGSGFYGGGNLLVLKSYLLGVENAKGNNFCFQKSCESYMYVW